MQHFWTNSFFVIAPNRANFRVKLAVGYMRSKLTIFKESISPKVFMKGNCPIREKITIKTLRMQNSGGA